MFAFLRVKVSLSLNRQKLLSVASSTPVITSLFVPLNIKTPFSFFPRRADFFFLFKSVPPQKSQIGWRYRSGASARTTPAPLGPYCPPARLCSGRTGTAGGFLRCCHLLRLQEPQLQSYSGTALILQTEAKRGGGG